MRYPKPKDQQWPAPQNMPTRYQRASQVWDDRMGTLVIQARNWRLAALMSIGGLLVAMLGCIYMSTKASVVPYLIEVEASGQVRLVGQVHTRDWSLSKSAKQKILHQWIHNLRAVSSDKHVMVSRLAALRTHSTVSANMQLDEYLKNNNPFEVVGKQMRIVHIEATTIIPGTDNAYRVQWREEVMDSGGVKLKTNAFIAEVHLSITPPKTEKELRANPLGVYVAFFDISQKQGVHP